MENPVSSARGRVSAMRGQVNEMWGRVRSVADFMFGTVDEKVQVPTNPGRLGEAGLLHDELELLQSELILLSAQISRIECLGEGDSAPRPTAAASARW